MNKILEDYNKALEKINAYIEKALEINGFSKTAYSLITRAISKDLVTFSFGQHDGVATRASFSSNLLNLGLDEFAKTILERKLKREEKSKNEADRERELKNFIVNTQEFKELNKIYNARGTHVEIKAADNYYIYNDYIYGLEF